ncbi:MAG: peptidase MA family metallohydrolase [Elusimicrobiota bacterium]
MGIFFLLIAGLGALGRTETAWKESPSPHFRIYHAARALPSGITIGLEKMHAKLRLHLGLFAPWMSKEKINLYIYQNEADYKNGEFKPPAWSKGVSSVEKNAVVLYTENDRENFFKTATHELTHLLFAGYFGARRERLPRWLEEEVAMLMEDLAATDSKTAVWLAAMKNKEAWTPESLKQFMKASPFQDASTKSVSNWYIQAYSLSRYLFIEKGRIKFKVFCDHLARGDSEEKALQAAYFLSNYNDFEWSWREWLKSRQK